VTANDFRDELDPRFLRRQWLWQRAGWAVMAAIILLALVGFFGTSPMASKVESKEVGSAQYEVEYPRWTRYQHLDRLHVRVLAPEATGDELRISFSREWVENNNVRSTTPEADGGGLAATGPVYSYKVEDWTRPLVVTMEYEPRKAFRSPGEITLTAGELEPVTLPLWSWVHP